MTHTVLKNNHPAPTAQNDLQLEGTEIGTASVPCIGQKIYVPASLYVYRGADDFMGGRATVSAVTRGISAGEPVHFVSIQERPGPKYNWEHWLAPQQEALKRQYGKQAAHPEPDLRPEFNDPEADWR